MAKIYYKDDNVAIIHGDCIEVMSKLKKPFDACITDPPYGTTRNKWDTIIPFDAMWERLHTTVKREQPTYNPQMRTGFKPYVAVHNGHTTNYGYEKGAVTVSNGDRFPVQMLDIKCNSKNKVHPTQKPVELIEYLIKTYTNEGERVLDFTCGSGTTLIACLNTGRKVVGIEMDEKYCEIAKQRVLQWYEEHK